MENNAGGAITDCDPPNSFAATWEFGGEASWIAVTLAPEDSGRTRLTLVHTAPITPHWAEYGPGPTGIGWELGLRGLATYLVDPQSKIDEDTFPGSSEGQAFIAGSGNAWAEAGIASGPDAAPDEQQEALRVLLAGQTLNFSRSVSSTFSFAGVTFILFGAAVPVAAVYPRWVGWVAIAAGALSIAAGIVQGLIGDPTVVTRTMTIIGPSVITTWLLVIGFPQVRRANLIETGVT